MVKHHKDHGKDCPPGVRVPPLVQWKTNEVVAFQNAPSFNSQYQQCCGATSNITIYSSGCFKFCGTEGNQTEVLDCIQHMTKSKAKGFNNETASKDPDAKSDPDPHESNAILARPLSKPAITIALMAFVSLMAGTL